MNARLTNERLYAINVRFFCGYLKGSMKETHYIFSILFEKTICLGREKEFRDIVLLEVLSTIYEYIWKHIVQDRLGYIV
jgi:hypothetical protein